MQENKKPANLCKRWLSAMILIPVVLLALVFSKLALQIIIITVATGMLIEWYDMTESKLSCLLSGVIVIAIPMSCLFLVTILLDDYRYALLTYAGIVWTVDSAAMFGGKTFGGRKLAPVLSPNKTWSGLACGMLGAIVIVSLISLLPGYEFPYHGVSLVVFAMVMAVIAQMSDLFISFFKRKFHLSDTGSIIPGHGGILDRCDSLIFTAPLLLYVLV